MQVSRESWDAVAAPSGNPFLSYDFLHALEESGSVSREQGWMPQHLLLFDPQDEKRLMGAVPLYLKGHSMGEYVFDQGVRVSTLTHSIALRRNPAPSSSLPERTEGCRLSSSAGQRRRASCLRVETL